jgi:serine/threonine protein kinase
MPYFSFIPNIITIKGAGITPRSFIAVEYLSGGTLDQYMLSSEESLLLKSVKKSSLLMYVGNKHIKSKSA